MLGASLCSWVLRHAPIAFAAHGGRRIEIGPTFEVTVRSQIMAVAKSGTLAVASLVSQPPSSSSTSASR